MASNNDKISVAVEPQAIATGENQLLSEQMTAAFDRMQEQVDQLKKEFSYLSQQNLSMYTATVDFIRKSVNGLNDSLSEELRGLKTAQEQNVIDYDLLAEKVAEKLRATEEKPVLEVDTEEFSSRLAEKMTLPPVEVDFEQLAQGIADRLTLPDITLSEVEVDANVLAEKIAEKVNLSVKAEEPDHDAIVGYILEALPALDYHLLAQNLAAELNNKSEEAVEDYVAAYEEAPVEEPVEETVEEVAEEPVEEIVEEVAEEPAEEIVEEVAEEPAEEIVEEVAEEPAEETVEEVAEEVAEEPVQELVEEPVEEGEVELVAEEPVEEVAEEPVEEVAEEPVEELVEEPIEENVIELVAEEPVEALEEVIDDADEPMIELFDESEEDNIAVAEAEEVVEEVPAEEVAEEAAAEETQEQDEEPNADPSLAAEEGEDVIEKDGQTVKEDSTTSILTAAGGTTIRLKRSYECKLRQSSDELKYYYGDLKNTLLSYEKVKSNMSWNGDRYNYGKITVVKMNIVGKTLCIYMALNPDDYSLTKYHQKYVGNVKTYESTPMMVKVKSHMGLKRATSLIGDMMDSFGAKKTEKAPVDYAEIYTYMTDEEMLASGQIKASITKKKDLNSF
jgi:hypothetical protein